MRVTWHVTQSESLQYTYSWFKKELEFWVVKGSNSPSHEHLSDKGKLQWLGLNLKLHLSKILLWGCLEECSRWLQLSMYCHSQLGFPNACVCSQTTHHLHSNFRSSLAQNSKHFFTKPLLVDLCYTSLCTFILFFFFPKIDFSCPKTKSKKISNILKPF